MGIIVDGQELDAPEGLVVKNFSDQVFDVCRASSHGFPTSICACIVIGTQISGR